MEDVRQICSGLNVMAQCWAACLGGCSGKITKEHTVSENVFSGDMLGVKGFPWCRHDHKFIPKKSFESNILCDGHNKELSHEVDPAGIKAFDVFRNVSEVTERRREKVKNQ